MIRYLTLLFCLCLTIQVHSQEDFTFCDQVIALSQLTQKEHYAPKTINDSLSVGVYNLFLEQLDENNNFFTQNYIDIFSEDKYKIDDYILNEDCSFIQKYTEALETCIMSSKAIVESLNNEVFDYSGTDTLYFSSANKFKYFKNYEDSKHFWSKRLRYEILSNIVEKDTMLSVLESKFSELESELKPKIIQNQLCLLDELLHKNGGLKRFVEESFLNSYMKYHDPNSSFFNNSDKSIFESSVANSYLTFGITTSKNNEGDIVISHITPGSVAFSQGQFEVNDVIKSLKAKDIILDTFCVSNDDITAFTNDEKYNTITFKIKKQDGSILDIELTKAEAKVEENTINGYIIDQKTNVGYISIPSFYTDMESNDGLGLANDVAKEIYKLQKENIEGLIIDLRFNGGGSMREAGELSSMFINRGPLSVLKYKNNEIFTVRDGNKGSLFRKPVIVMINHFSASASELFAGVLQDYNRAVIVGSPSHGKASVQIVLPLNENNEDLGFSKLTIEKFYRVTGKSHQSIGIIPDVVLPSLYDDFNTSERFEKFALHNDTVSVEVKHFPQQKFPLETIAAKSKERVLNSNSFKAVKTLNAKVVSEYINKNTKYPLTLQNVYKENDDYNKAWQEFYAITDNNTSLLSVKNSKYTEAKLKSNPSRVDSNNEVLNDLKKDIYLEEAYNILIDVINANASN